jgi:hypothetical protein
VQESPLADRGLAWGSGQLERAPAASTETASSEPGPSKSDRRVERAGLGTVLADDGVLPRQSRRDIARDSWMAPRPRHGDKLLVLLDRLAGPDFVLRWTLRDCRREGRACWSRPPSDDASADDSAFHTDAADVVAPAAAQRPPPTVAPVVQRLVAALSVAPVGPPAPAVG